MRRRTIAGIQTQGRCSGIRDRPARLAAESRQESPDRPVAAGAGGPFARAADVDRQRGIRRCRNISRGRHRRELGEVQRAGAEDSPARVSIRATEDPGARSRFGDLHRVDHVGCVDDDARVLRSTGRLTECDNSRLRIDRSDGCHGRDIVPEIASPTWIPSTEANVSVVAVFPF